MGPAWGIVPLRLVLGVVFEAHGTQKLFEFGIGGTAGFLASLGIPLPTLAAVVVIMVELLGGLALILGAWTRMVAALLAAEMLVAMLTVHARGGFFAPDGIEYVLTLFAACLALAVLGAGAWSVDRASRA